jgi:hypothetical protein
MGGLWLCATMFDRSKNMQQPWEKGCCLQPASAAEQVLYIPVLLKLQAGDTIG